MPLCVQAVHPCAACCAQQSLCAALQPPAVRCQGRCDRQAVAALGATQARHQGPEEQTQGPTNTQGGRAPATETKNNISSCLAVMGTLLCSCKEHHGLRSVGRPQHKHDHQPLSFEPLLLRETRTQQSHNVPVLSDLHGDLINDRHAGQQQSWISSKPAMQQE